MLYLFWHQTPFCFPHTAVIIIGSQTPRALSTTAAFSFLPGCISNRGGIAVCVCVSWVTCGHAWLAHDITLWWFTLLALSLSLSSGGTASKNFYNHQSAAATFPLWLFSTSRPSNMHMCFHYFVAYDPLFTQCDIMFCLWGAVDEPFYPSKKNNTTGNGDYSIASYMYCYTAECKGAQLLYFYSL